MKNRIKYLFVLMAMAIILNALNVIIGLITKQYIGAFASFIMCWAIFEVGSALYEWQKDDSQKIRKQNYDLRLDNMKRFAEIVKLKEVLKQICFKFNIVASSAEFNRLLLGADSEFLVTKILERIETHKAVCNEQEG